MVLGTDDELDSAEYFFKNKNSEHIKVGASVILFHTYFFGIFRSPKDHLIGGIAASPDPTTPSPVSGSGSAVGTTMGFPSGSAALSRIVMVVPIPFSAAVSSVPVSVAAVIAAAAAYAATAYAAAAVVPLGIRPLPAPAG